MLISCLSRSVASDHWVYVHCLSMSLLWDARYKLNMVVGLKQNSCQSDHHYNEFCRSIEYRNKRIVPDNMFHINGNQSIHIVYR